MRINTGYNETCNLCGHNLRDDWCVSDPPEEMKCLDCGRIFLNWSQQSRIENPQILVPRFVRNVPKHEHEVE